MSKLTPDCPLRPVYALSSCSHYNPPIAQARNLGVIFEVCVPHLHIWCPIHSKFYCFFLQDVCQAHQTLHGNHLCSPLPWTPAVASFHTATLASNQISPFTASRDYLKMWPVSCFSFIWGLLFTENKILTTRRSCKAAVHTYLTSINSDHSPTCSPTSAMVGCGLNCAHSSKICWSPNSWNQ